MSPKGTRTHRALGYLFIALMLTTAASSFFIREPGGGFSWLHLFIPATLFNIALGYWFIKRGNVFGHKAMMSALYFESIGIAGLLAPLPGRIMHRIFFGG